jgi:ATP-dependent DNA helicase RecG
MIAYCRSAGLPEPEFKLRDGFLVILHRPQHGPPGQPPGPPAREAGGEAAPPAPPALPVAEEVKKLLMVCEGAMTREELQKRLHLKGLANFRRLYLAPALEGGFIEMPLPDKPKSHS